MVIISYRNNNSGILLIAIYLCRKLPKSIICIMETNNKIKLIARILWSKLKGDTPSIPDTNGNTSTNTSDQPPCYHTCGGKCDHYCTCSEGGCNGCSGECQHTIGECVSGCAKGTSVCGPTCE